MSDMNLGLTEKLKPIHARSPDSTSVASTWPHERQRTTVPAPLV